MSVINFDSENLKVDYLSLNLQFTNLSQIEEIADFLLDTFNCRTFLKDEVAKTRNPLVETGRSRYWGEFIVNSSKHWRGTILCFKGNSASRFYEDLKGHPLDWVLFDLEYTNLGRLDLCYDRELKESDGDPYIFLKESCYRNENRQARMPTNVLRVGSRSGPNYFRVYLRKNGRDIRFELEIKKDVGKKFQHYLFTSQFEKFEELLCEYYYDQSVQIFDTDNPFCDWLRANFRRVRKLPLGEVLMNSLSTSYLTGKPLNDFNKVEFLYRLIQLINYLKTLESSSQLILMGDRTYRVFKFPVNHFLDFLGKPKGNYYQVKKLVKFLDSLQEIKPILECFSDGGFRKYVAFPYLKLERGRCWWVEFAICQELDLYRYPFHLPGKFLNYRDNFELKVKFLVLQSFCNISI